MKTFHVSGPGGKKYAVHADSEEALDAALGELFPEPPPPPPDRAAQTVELLTKLVEKEHPAFPAFPEIPAPPKVDLAPVVEALRAIEAKDVPATDIQPLSDKLDVLGGLITRLANAISKANAAQEERHGAVVEAIDRLQRTMSAPRKLVRENGRPVAAVVDLAGEYDDRTVN